MIMRENSNNNMRMNIMEMNIIMKNMTKVDNQQSMVKLMTMGKRQGLIGYIKAIKTRELRKKHLTSKAVLVDQQLKRQMIQLEKLLVKEQKIKVRKNK